MNKYILPLTLSITCFMVGYVNSRPVPHETMVLYNAFAVGGIGYIIYQTIREWTKFK